MNPLCTAMRMRLRDEAMYGRLPLLREERAHAAGNGVVSGLQYALSAWGLLVGGYMANSVGAVTGLVVLLAGCLLGALMAATAALPCNRYGLDATDAAKPCLGQRGAKVLLLIFVLSHLAWAGLMLVMFGRGVQNFLGALGLVRGSGVVSLMVALGIVITYTGVVGGGGGLTRLRNLAIPSLVMIGGIVLFAVLHDIAWQDLIRIPPLTPHADTRLRALGAFECALGVGLSWWPSVARMSRYADGQRASFYPPWLSLSLATTAMGASGLCAALLLRNYDPTQWLVFLGGRAFGAMSLAVVIITNLAAVARMMRATTLGLQHLPGLRALGWRGCVALLFAPLWLFAAYPHVLYERGDVIITINGYILAPLCTIMAVDHLLLRHQRLNITQVFEAQPHGHYWFYGGFNLCAWLAATVGMAMAWHLYNPQTFVAHPWARVAGATLPGALAAGVLYAVSSCITAAFVQNARGGYGAENAPTKLSVADI